MATQDMGTDPTIFHIWWISGRIIQHLGKTPEWTKYPDVPQYIKKQYAYLTRSSVHGNLWIDDSIPHVVVPQYGIPPECNGIVFHAEDLKVMKALPGFITEVSYIQEASSEMSELERFLENVTGVVHATTFEQTILFNENKTSENPKTWVQNYTGICEVIGHVADMGVNIMLTTAMVDGQKILFFTTVSSIADHNMAYRWLKDNLPSSALRQSNDGYLNYVDAQNFHCVFQRSAR